MARSWIGHGSNVLMIGLKRKPIEAKTRTLAVSQIWTTYKSSPYHQPSFDDVNGYPRYTTYGSPYGSPRSSTPSPILKPGPTVYPRMQEAPARRHRRPTYDSSLYHHPFFDDVNGRYPRYNTYDSPGIRVVPLPGSPRSSTPSPILKPGPTVYPEAPAYLPSTVVQLPPMGSPHSTRSSKSDNTSTINRPGHSQPIPQPSDGDMTSATVIPERTLYPIPESSPSEDEYNNALGFSSGLENRSSLGGGDVAPDDGNHVRFRLPTSSSDSSNDWEGILRKTHLRKTPKR